LVNSPSSAFYRTSGSNACYSELDLMRQCQRPIFVLAQASGPVFAFEAENAMVAEKLAQTPSFARALTGFCAGGHKGWNDDRPWHVRAATGAEATFYRNRSAEFAEELSQLLVVPVDDP
jgi:hypothetical protein